MLTSPNPGTFDVVTVSTPGFVLFIFLALGLVGLSIIIFGLMTHRLAVYILGFLVAFGPFITYEILSSIDSDAARAEQAAEYTDTVRNWLNSDYDIAVSLVDATKLIHGKELALVIGGEPTAIELIDGSAETVAVKVVGGSILAPTE